MFCHFLLMKPDARNLPTSILTKIIELWNTQLHPKNSFKFLSLLQFTDWIEDHLNSLSKGYKRQTQDYSNAFQCILERKETSGCFLKPKDAQFTCVQTVFHSVNEWSLDVTEGELQSLGGVRGNRLLNCSFKLLILFSYITHICSPKLIIGAHYLLWTQWVCWFEGDFVWNVNVLRLNHCFLVLTAFNWQKMLKGN